MAIYSEIHSKNIEKEIQQETPPGFGTTIDLLKRMLT